MGAACWELFCLEHGKIFFSKFETFIGINPSGLLPEENAHLNDDDSF